MAGSARARGTAFIGLRRIVGAALVAAVSIATGVTAARAGWSGRRHSWSALSDRGPATVDEVIGAAATLAGLGCLSWLAASLGCAVIAQVPGRLGAVGAAVGERITPVLVRRLVSAVLGVGLVGAVPAGALAASPVASPSSVIAATATPLHPWDNTAVPSLDRPGAPPGLAPSAPVAPTAPAELTVQPGDCLWTIAARQLPSDASDALIDQEWRRWYATNRDVIGPDPDVISPGQRLVAPS